MNVQQEPDNDSLIGILERIERLHGEPHGKTLGERQAQQARMEELMELYNKQAGWRAFKTIIQNIL